MTTLPFPLSGSTLIVGPSQAGKTRLTACALDAWVEREGPGGVVVFEFAPEVERGGTVLGGRLDRFTIIPDRAWYGILDAHAPRSESRTDEEAVTLAENNAMRAQQILNAAPEPRAVFINDATIPLQHTSIDPAWLTGYCDHAECIVLNAFESDELGTGDPISRREREILFFLHKWADCEVRLNQRR